MISKNREKEQKKEIRCLCMMLYLFCILNVMGVSVNLKNVEREYDNFHNEEAMETDAQPEKEPEEAEPEDTLSEKPKIALTFDDGPSDACTGKLLDGLKERNVKATFFVIGKNVKENPKLTKRICDEGHLIGNHTYSHIEMDKVTEEEAKKELEAASNEVYALTGKYPEYMRPPYGVCSRSLEDSLDMILVRWTIDPLDWKIENADKIVHKVVTQAQENDIILLHDCYDSSVDAALRIIDILQKKGFEFVTVDRLFLD